MHPIPPVGCLFCFSRKRAGGGGRERFSAKGFFFLLDPSWGTKKEIEEEEEEEGLYDLVIPPYHPRLLTDARSKKGVLKTKVWGRVA